MKLVGFLGTAFSLFATGTALQGQSLIKDIRSPSGNPSSSPQWITTLGSVAIFTAADDYGREPWRSDGTIVGTYRLRDIEPGAAGSSANNFVTVGNYCYFLATVGGLGTELWRTDGTPSGTIPLGDINPGSSGAFIEHMTGFQGKLWFRATSPGSGHELWVSDGTPAGTQDTASAINLKLPPNG